MKLGKKDTLRASTGKASWRIKFLTCGTKLLKKLLDKNNGNMFKIMKKANMNYEIQLNGQLLSYNDS